MTYTFYRETHDGWVKREWDDISAFIADMMVSGFGFKGLNCNRAHRVELVGEPIFVGVAGPMWDGGPIRYEHALPARFR